MADPLGRALGGAEGFWANFGDALEGLALIAFGILGYALVVNAFYQVISRRIMFGRKLRDGRIVLGDGKHAVAYIATFPLISLAYFLLLSMALLFLGGSERDPLVIFTTSMAILAAVRIAAYVSEPASHDLAKMLPLGLLGVFLVQQEFTSFVAALRQMFTIVDHFAVVAVYFGFVVFLEFGLRLAWAIKRAVAGT